MALIESNLTTTIAILEGASAMKPHEDLQNNNYEGEKGTFGFDAIYLLYSGSRIGWLLGILVLCLLNGRERHERKNNLSGGSIFMVGQS